MANERFLKERKAIWIQRRFRDKEALIKVAKSQAAALGIRGKIIVVDIGNYNPDLDGQSVVVEFGREYTPSGSGRRELRKIDAG